MGGMRRGEAPQAWGDNDAHDRGTNKQKQRREPMPKSDFWGKKDRVSMARSLRLATVQSVFDQGLIDEAGAKRFLSKPLSPGGEACDDSACLDLDREPCLDLDWIGVDD